MTDAWDSRAYELVVAPAAKRLIDRLATPDAEELTLALRTELMDGPNATREVRFGSGMWDDAAPGDDLNYTATPLSFGGYTAIHRPLSAAEIGRLARQLGRPAASDGVYLIDILPAWSAFRPWPRVL